MLRSRIEKHLEAFLVCNERSLIGQPTCVDPFIRLGIMDKQRRFNLRQFFRAWLATIIWDGYRHFGIGLRQRCTRRRHSKTPQRPLCPCFRDDPADIQSWQKNPPATWPDQLRLQRAARFIIAGIAANRGQAVGANRHIARPGETPHDVFDIQDKPAIFSDQQHLRQFALCLWGLGQQAMMLP